MNEIPTPEQEIARGEQARQIFETPVFKDACNRIDAELRALRESVPMSDADMHTRLILAEQMFGKLLDHLKMLMIGADYARQQLKLRESFSERMVQAVKQGIRL